MSWDFGGGGSGSTSGDDWGDLSTPPASPGNRSGFGGGGFGEAGRTLAPAGAGGVTAPVLWLALGVGLAVIAIVVHVLGSGFWPGLAGWMIGGPIVIGVLAVFVNQDTARRADPWYAESAVAPWGRRFLVVLSLVAVVLNSLSISDFFSRGGF